MRLIITTVGDAERAAELSRALVEERLAACVNIVPGVRSIYRWHNAIEDEGEFLLIVKTSRELVDALRARLTEIHPYEVPEIVVIEPESVSTAYFNWLTESVTTRS